jgi:hypothetical protein
METRTVTAKLFIIKVTREDSTDDVSVQQEGMDYNQLIALCISPYAALYRQRNSPV